MIGIDDPPCSLNVKTSNSSKSAFHFHYDPLCAHYFKWAQRPWCIISEEKFQLFCQQLILNSRPTSYRSTFRTQLQTDQYSVLSTKTKLGDKEEKSLTMRTSQRKRAIAFHCLLLLLLCLFFLSRGTASAIKGSLKNKHENISSIRPPQMAALLETSACVGSQVSDACTVQPL